MTPELNMKPTSWFDYLGCDIDSSLLKQLHILPRIATNLAQDALIYRVTYSPCRRVYCIYLLTCTCVGIHPEWVEPVSPIELTTSRTEALQAGRSCARDLRPILSLSCVVEDSRSGEGFQVCLDRGCPYLQLISSSSAPLAM